MHSELVAYLASALLAGGLIGAGWALRRLLSRIHRDPFAGARR